MKKFSDAFVDSVKTKILGKTKKTLSTTFEKRSPEKVSTTLKIVAKNFMSISGMARDLNVSKQNIARLVKLMGGQPKVGEQVDAFFLKEDERERKLESERAEQLKKEDQRVTVVTKPTKKKGFLAKLMDMFSIEKIVGEFTKYLQLAGIAAIIFFAFKDLIAEWANELWKPIVEKFTEITSQIKQWFVEIVKPIMDYVGEKVNVMMQKIVDFFRPVFDWVIKKIEFIFDSLQPVFDFIANIWNKFMGVVDGIKEKLQPMLQDIANFAGKDGPIAKTIQSTGIGSFFGVKDPEKTQKQLEDERKSEQAKKDAAEKERVSKLKGRERELTEQLNKEIKLRQDVEKREKGLSEELNKERTVRKNIEKEFAIKESKAAEMLEQERTARLQTEKYYRQELEDAKKIINQYEKMPEGELTIGSVLTDSSGKPVVDGSGKAIVVPSISAGKQGRVGEAGVGTRGPAFGEKPKEAEPKYKPQPKVEKEEAIPTPPVRKAVPVPAPVPEIKKEPLPVEKEKPVEQKQPAVPTPQVPEKKIPQPITPTVPQEKPKSGVLGTIAQIIKELFNFGISSVKSQANILAQIAEESGFKPINENLEKYTGKNLFMLYGPPKTPFEYNGKKYKVPEHSNKIRFPTIQDAIDLVKKGPEMIGDVIYGGRMGNKSPGDGYKYRGRGFVQITGRGMYEALGKFLGINLVSDPDKINDPEVAAKVVPAFFAVKLKERKKKVDDLENINTVNSLVGSAKEESREERKKLALDFESKIKTGEYIQESSTQNESSKRKQQNSGKPVDVNVPTTNYNTYQKNEVPTRKDKGTVDPLLNRAM